MLFPLALVKELLPVFNGDSRVEPSQNRQVFLNKYFARLLADDQMQYTTAAGGAHHDLSVIG